MRHRRSSLAVRAGLLAFRVARMGLLVCVGLALLALALWLCFVSTPAP
ncbi:hypothetical protein ACWDWU_27645 [Streptomyces sp. NPDC003442]